MKNEHSVAATCFRNESDSEEKINFWKKQQTFRKEIILTDKKV